MLHPPGLSHRPQLQIRWPHALAALALAAGLLAVLACAGHPKPGAEAVRERSTGWHERGTASWYGGKFHGRRTANGEVYDMDGFTAAHRTLPFGTWVRVTNLDNDRRVEVRINDRGPFVRGRILDVSRAAARELGMIGPGTARVVIEVLEGPVTPRAVPASARSFAVQAGAFRESRRARRLAEQLERQGFEADLVSRDGWHRVRVGVFEDRDRAEARRRELRRLGYEAVLVAVR